MGSGAGSGDTDNAWGRARGEEGRKGREKGRGEREGKKGGEKGPGRARQQRHTRGGRCHEMAAPPGRPRRRGVAALRACLWVSYQQGRCFFLTERIGRAPSRC